MSETTKRDPKKLVKVSQGLLSQIAYAFGALGDLLETSPGNGVFGTTARLIYEAVGEGGREVSGHPKARRKHRTDYCPMCGGSVTLLRRAFRVGER